MLGFVLRPPAQPTLIEPTAPVCLLQGHQLYRLAYALQQARALNQECAVPCQLRYRCRRPVSRMRCSLRCGGGQLVENSSRHNPNYTNLVMEPRSAMSSSLKSRSSKSSPSNSTGTSTNTTCKDSKRIPQPAHEPAWSLAACSMRSAARKAESRDACTSKHEFGSWLPLTTWMHLETAHSSTNIMKALC